MFRQLDSGSTVHILVQVKGAPGIVPCLTYTAVPIFPPQKD